MTAHGKLVSPAGACRRYLAAALMTLLLTACSDSPDTPTDRGVAAARDACVTAVQLTHSACARQCPRFPDAAAAAACASACSDTAQAHITLCAAPLQAFADACRGAGCAAAVDDCRDSAASELASCSAACDSADLRCNARCETRGAAAQRSCGFLPVTTLAGGVAPPSLPQGQPAFLPGLLDEAEIAVVEAADARARELRTRSVRLWTGEPGTAVRVTQLEHGFRFGVPLDIREFELGGEPLAFYADIARSHASLLVAETSLKWRNVEREQDQVSFDLADTELAWAEALGFDLKAHVLLWGNHPPLASGSGTPDWLRETFPEKALGDDEQQALRDLIREHVQSVVTRYAGRIDVWEVTNEMLNPITDWFAARLGQGITDEVFRWARAADPGAELVYNEWINEIFTGLGGPDAAAVRDRVIQLREAGVPVDALGQQGHFAPGLVNVGVDVDLSQRTRVDDYAAALDTLAEAGLPIHITEVTFAAPAEPEHRAAQAEAIMRVWWGHPAVEEIILWNFWNPLGPRSHLNLGIFGDDRNPTRHGEALLSLLNDRWRTDVQGRTGVDGAIELRATHGQYVAQWDTGAGPVHVRFEVLPGPGTLDVVALQEPAMP